MVGSWRNTGWGLTIRMKMSRRISLSPFPTLRHHSGTIPGPSITFQAFYHIPSCSFPSSSLHSLLRPLHQHSRPSLPFPASPFPSAILRFYLYPVSLRYSPFLSELRFCPPFSVSICTLFLSSRSPFLPGGQLDKAAHQILLLTDILCLATSPYISVSFPYISRYT